MDKRGFGLIMLIVVGVIAFVVGGVIIGQVGAQFAPRIPDSGVGGPGIDSLECDVFPRDGSGENTCLSNGFDFCLVAEYHRTTTYLDSVNSSCNGEIQVKIETPFVGECPGIGGGGGGGCGFNSDGVEPYYGDQSVGQPTGETNIVCCR